MVDINDSKISNTRDSGDSPLIVADLVAQAKKSLQSGRFVEVVATLEPVLALIPGGANLGGEGDIDADTNLYNVSSDYTDALYLVAVAQRYRNKPDQALAGLQRLQALDPGYGRTYQERGHVYRSIGDTEAAIGAYVQAVECNPALVASWKALVELRQKQGDFAASERARRQYMRLSQLPAELLSVTSFIHEGKLYKAERLCRFFLQRHPHHIEAMRLLAQLGIKLHVLDDAEFLLESCLEFAPEHRAARYDYVDVLRKRQKYRQAMQQAEILCATEPANTGFKTVYANVCLGAGDFDRALSIYDELIAAAPENSHTQLVRGHALKTVGRQSDAIAGYRRAYRIKPDFGDAFWSLANLKTYRFTDAEIAQMREREQAAGTALEDRFHLCFALGKAFEDRRDFATSFIYYERGNALKKRQIRYRAERIDREFKAQMKVCSRELFASNTGGCPSSAPIFVVGLPRAGSTLLEQILASHSLVDGTMELPNILALAHRLNGRRGISDAARYPGILSELSSEKRRQFGEDYIADTQLYRQGAPYFIDKMPNNFRHIGLIHLILPNAKIIDARRHPMACCFSGFKQLFAEGQEFTYGLEEVGRYYKGYVELMRHWDEVLPGKILRVQYEEVVADLETQVRRLLDFCELPFEPQCLEFYRTERSVRTASSEQVRQPIYDNGLEQWRNFEAYLQPLKAALGDIATEFPI